MQRARWHAEGMRRARWHAEGMRRARWHAEGTVACCGQDGRVARLDALISRDGSIDRHRAEGERRAGVGRMQNQRERRRKLVRLGARWGAGGGACICVGGRRVVAVVREALKVSKGGGGEDGPNRRHDVCERRPYDELGCGAWLCESQRANEHRTQVDQSTNTHTSTAG
jgi:hypothetical protein